MHCIIIIIFFFAVPLGLWDFSSPTRDQTRPPGHCTKAQRGDRRLTRGDAANRPSRIGVRRLRAVFSLLPQTSEPCAFTGASSEWAFPSHMSQLKAVQKILGGEQRGGTHRARFTTGSRML